MAFFIHRCFRYLSRGVASISIFLATCFLVLTVCLFGANVFARYVLNSPIFWVDEITVYLMIWSVFLGAVGVSMEDTHLKFGVLGRQTNDALTRLLLGIGFVVSLAILLLVAYLGWDFILFLIEIDRRSSALDLSMAIPFASVPLGFSLMALAMLLRFFSGQEEVPKPSLD